jgi:hypothetical protein
LIVRTHRPAAPRVVVDLRNVELAWTSLRHEAPFSYQASSQVTSVLRDMMRILPLTLGEGKTVSRCADRPAASATAPTHASV